MVQKDGEDGEELTRPFVASQSTPRPLVGNPSAYNACSHTSHCEDIRHPTTRTLHEGKQAGTSTAHKGLVKAYIIPCAPSQATFFWKLPCHQIPTLTLVIRVLVDIYSSVHGIRRYTAMKTLTLLSTSTAPHGKDTRRSLMIHKQATRATILPCEKSNTGTALATMPSNDSFPTSPRRWHSCSTGNACNIYTYKRFGTSNSIHALISG